ncbi:hypothetical protein [Amaricoccus tamworthensis]|uniref:hypothetical protein n=1 Tax=Amaricoccus tamworthensis TaxID=57002 RepID=UPI003C79C184
MQRKIGVLVTAFFYAVVRWYLFESDAITNRLMFSIATAPILKHLPTDWQMPQNITAAYPDPGFGTVMFLVVANTFGPSVVSSWNAPN